MPVRTISCTPASCSRAVSRSACSGGRERTLPRAYGIMQYEQKLLHPSSIFSSARVLPLGMPAGSSSYPGASPVCGFASRPSTAASHKSIVCARLDVPHTRSISPVARIRSGSVWAKQPQAAITACGLSLRSLWNARIFL